MKIRAAVSILCLGALTSAALAETIVVDDKVVVRESTVPHPSGGMRMAQVEQKFGQPVNRHPTVGEPPITRWDYPGFAVFFEHDRVIHAVVTPAETPQSKSSETPEGKSQAPEGKPDAPAPQSPPAQAPAPDSAAAPTPPAA